MAIALMVTERRVPAFLSVRSALTIPVSSFQTMVSWPTSLLDHIEHLVVTHDSLVKENVVLKENQLVLQAQLQRLVAIENENNYLKALLQSSKQVKSRTLIAELLAVDVEPFVNQVILDKGKVDGVYLGQPVLDAYGIMGQVIQVEPYTSRVLLINDPHSGVAIQNARTGMRAVAVGDSYSGKLRILYVPKTADIQSGDLFLTSGLGDRYPGGFPVGKVVEVYRDPGHQFANITLEPAARLGSSRQVLLIWTQGKP